MNCPKCNGETYASDEEAVKVLENTTPIKIIIRVTYICRSCGERFTRIVSEDVEARRKEQEPAPGFPTHEYAVRPGMSTTGVTQEPAEKLRFLDKI
jgi:hypothetical protein